MEPGGQQLLHGRAESAHRGPATQGIGRSVCVMCVSVSRDVFMCVCIVRRSAFQSSQQHIVQGVLFHFHLISLANDQKVADLQS